MAMTTKKKVFIGVAIAVIILLLWLLRRKNLTASLDTPAGGSSGSSSGGKTDPVGKKSAVDMSTYNSCGCSPALNKVTSERLAAERKYQQSVVDYLNKQAEQINAIYGGT